MHNRTAIRSALETLLGSLTFTVYIEHPGTRIDSALRPLGILALNSDPAEEFTMREPPKVTRAQELVVELHADGATGKLVAEQIDAMELELETALASDLTLGGLCQSIYPVVSEMEWEDAQDRVIGQRTVNYTIYWRSAFGSPDTPE